MIFQPTKSRRNVVLALRFAQSKAARAGVRASNACRVVSICGLFADHESITEGIYRDFDEATLLHRFWLAIRPTDRIFAADANRVLSLLRERSWVLNLIPSPEIDLRRIYGPELLDTQRMWSRDGVTPPTERACV